MIAIIEQKLEAEKSKWQQQQSAATSNKRVEASTQIPRGFNEDQQ